MILKDLRDYLEENEDLSDKLTHETWGFRCYADRVPQAVPNPCITLEVSSTTPRYLLSNESKLAETLVHVAVYADKRHLADEILELIRLAPLSAFRGQMGDTWVVATTLENEGASHEVPNDASDSWEWQAMADYRFQYHRAQPY